MELLKKPKKSLGQNFLVDKNIINKIIKIANITKDKSILEIGSGYGNLTNEIVKMNPKKVFAIEKDKDLSSYLKNKFINIKNIEVINSDILELIKKNFINEKVIVFGNLPYNISTRILSSLIMIEQWPPWYDTLIFMFQKEVAERILAKSETKKINRLSILSNWRLEIKKHFDISSNCFLPKPKVDSTLLSFTPKINYKFNLKNPKNLEKITQILFSNRRKMIGKNLNKLFKQNKKIVSSLKIKHSLRPEDLNNETFYKIATVYEKSIC